MLKISQVFVEGNTPRRPSGLVGNLTTYTYCGRREFDSCESHNLYYFFRNRKQSVITWVSKIEPLIDEL